MAAVTQMADEGITRIRDAILRSIRSLPAASRAQVETHLKADSIWALSIVFGIWAGLQLLPAGPLFETVKSSAGGLVLSPVYSSLTAAVRRASVAQSPGQIDQAGRELLAIWQKVGIDTVTSLASSSQFRQMQAQILRVNPGPRAVQKTSLKQEGPAAVSGQEPGTRAPDGSTRASTSRETSLAQTQGNADNLLDGRLHRLPAGGAQRASARPGRIALWTFLGTGLAVLGVGAALAVSPRRRPSSL